MRPSLLAAPALTAALSLAGACGGDSASPPDAPAGADAAPAADAAPDAPGDGPAPAARTRRISVTSQGGEAHGNSGDLPTISGDGRYIAFTSAAPDLVADDTNDAVDVFLHDRMTGATTRLSVGPGGVEGNAGSSTGWIARTGRHVCFTSSASNLIASDTNGGDDVFILDRDTGTYVRANVTTAGVVAPGATCGSIADDGRAVSFYSMSTAFVPGDTSGTYDVFVRDLDAGTTVRASTGSGFAIGSMIAPDGAFVAFASDGANVVAGDGNAAQDIFERPSAGGDATLVSRSTTGGVGDGPSNVPFVSGDGGSIAFVSGASNLVPGDTNATHDVFVYTRATGAIERVSVGLNGAEPDGASENPKLSHDGRKVLFISYASNLVTEDTNGKRDAFLYDRDTGTTVRVSVGDADQQGTGQTYYASLSDDGAFAVFTSASTELVPGDTNGEADVFLRDLRP